MSDIAIKVEKVSKVYRLYSNHSDRIKEAFHPFRKKYHTDFYALKNVSFEIKRGETVGIIGKNGSGKSTLLKIISGVSTPTEGRVYVKGSISALLELGIGFNSELTGIENIYFSCTIQGLNKEEVENKMDSILSFADIGEYIFQPVKTYSSGMVVRLAFAIATCGDPDILIVDEALAVGDIRFQLKCFRKFEELKERGKTILFVTHDTGAALNLCKKTIWLFDGSLKRIDNTKKVCRDYISYMHYGLINKNVPDIERKHGNLAYCKDLESVSHCSSFGSGEAIIEKVGLFSAKTGEKIEIIKGEERIRLLMRIKALNDIEHPIVGFVLKNSYGNSILGANSFVYEKNIKPLKKLEYSTVEFVFQFPLLKNGKYSFSVAVAEGTQNNHIQHHWVHDAYVIQIANTVAYASVDNCLLLRNIDLTINQY